MKDQLVEIEKLERMKMIKQTLTSRSFESYSVISVKNATVLPTKFNEVKFKAFENFYSLKKF